jgi:PTS system galactitol-specific IIB component
MKTLYLVCATGIATSSMIRVKITDFLETKGIEVDVHNFRVAEMFPERITADLIVATTQVPQEITDNFKVINGLPLLTGAGEDETLEAIAAALKD